MVSMQPLTNRYLMRVECIQRALFTPGYVDSTQDRLCEPNFQRSTAPSGVQVYGQDYLGAGMSPLRNQDKG